MEVVKAITRNPNIQVVEILETKLAQARNGEIESVVIVAVKSNGTTHHAWGGITDDNVPRIIGETFVASNLLATILNEDE